MQACSLIKKLCNGKMIKRASIRYITLKNYKDGSSYNSKNSRARNGKQCINAFRLRAHAIHPIAAIQNEYSMLWRGPEEVIIPLCQELGIGFVPWNPLGVGFLTGAIDANTRFAPGDIRGGESRFSPENLPKNLFIYILKFRYCKTFRY